jgi:hypothetical protein
MRRAKPSRDRVSVYLERARESRQTADRAKDPETRNYWLAAEAYWLSLANKLESMAVTGSKFSSRA